PVAAPPVTPSTPPPTQPSTASAPDVAVRKIIRNGTIEFEVRSFDDTYATVATVVSENSGFVSSTSSDKLANGKVRGSIVVRVPPERLDRFLLQLRSLGDLKSQQIAANDVTKQYTDIASELRGLRTMEGRLLDLIKTGKGEVKDLVEAEKQLGEYRIRIEKLEGEISYYNNLVGMATITITAYEKDIQKPTAAAEQESVILNVETEEVETKYQAARKVIEEAKGRIVESQLKNTDAEHIAATIVADVPPDKADFVAAQLKQLGKVSSYNRDRRQTTTGGPGAPPPGVQVEQKDTRFSIALYNLANLAPRETTVLRVAVRDVQDTYRKTLSAVRKETGAPGAAPAEGGDNAANNAADKAATRAAGRVLSSNLTGQQADQMAATIVAEVRADQADAVLELIRSSGEVLASALATNQDNASSTSAKRGIQLTLVNFSTVAPKEVDTLNIAVPDVDEAYKKLLVLIRTDVPPPAPGQAPANPLLPSTTGRVLASNVNGQQPEQMVADIRAEIRSDQAQRVLDAVRGSGEILNSTSAETPEANNSTLAKRGLQVRLVNVAAIGAREAQALRLVAADVPEAYTRLLSSLQDMQTAGNARVISSQLNQNDARNVTATMTFDAQRKALPSVDKAFKDAGVDFLSRNIVRSTDTSGTLDTKVRFQIDALVSADSLEPRRKTVLAVEVDDPEKAMEIMRSGIAGTPAREVDFNMASDKSGRVTGTIVIEAPVSNIPAILDRAHHLGDEKVNQVVKNQQVSDTRFARERVELTLSSRAPIVSSDKGLGSTIRAALSAAAGALLYSMYLVVTGVLFVLPFALLIWVGMVVFRRRKAAA
ncbi:MAG TPA: DUF4349 domain-containing protein, partial [Tepidisphaeraceae bacterium]|nr:DUF4349 domain-containing protein [Tepidisphaeraceae bacterium]